MLQPLPNDRVRWTKAVPTLWLARGDVGVVRSVWSSSPGFCEVEFEKSGESFGVRALIQGDELEVVEVAPTNGSRRAERN
jgi:hypothetical protein